MFQIVIILHNVIFFFLLYLYQINADLVSRGDFETLISPTDPKPLNDNVMKIIKL